MEAMSNKQTKQLLMNLQLVFLEVGYFGKNMLKIKLVPWNKVSVLT